MKKTFSTAIIIQLTKNTCPEKKNTVKEIYKILYIVWSSGLSFIGEISSTSEIKNEIKKILSYLLEFHLLEHVSPKKKKNQISMYVSNKWPEKKEKIPLNFIFSFLKKAIFD